MNKTYTNSFLLSIIIHGLLFIAIIISSFLDRPQIVQTTGKAIAQKDKPIIQAGLIGHKAIESAIARQNKQERDKQEQFNRQRANAEKEKKAAEKIKLEAQKLKQEVADAKKKAEQEKKLALVAKEAAEKAKLQAAKEQEKAKLANEQAAQKLTKIKQAVAQAALERKQALAEQAQKKAEQEQQALELARAQQQQAEHNRWIDNELSRYAGEIERRIKENRTISTAFAPDLKCDIRIKLLPDGSVHEVKIITSSGNAAYDAISEAAVYKAAPFNMPEERELLTRLRDIIVGLKAADDNSSY